MKFPKPLRLDELAEKLGATYKGAPDHMVYGLNEIHRVEKGDLTFSDVQKYFQKAFQSEASTIIVNDPDAEAPRFKALLISEDPFRDFVRMAREYRPRRRLDQHSSPMLPNSVRLGQNVVLGKNVSFGEGVEIGHNVVVGSNVHIGDNTLIYPNVTIYDYTEIGSNCIIHAGTTIGSDAFYYKRRDWGREKMFSAGGTRIADHVEIGANCSIDRGVTDLTLIGEGTKLDNLVQIGHDTIIGKNCVFAAQVGIAGVCTIGDNVQIWGQGGLAQGLTIGDDAVIMAQSGLMNDVRPYQKVMGSPASELREHFRKQATLSRLAERWNDLEALLDRLGEKPR